MDERSAWPGLLLERRVEEGNRNEVWIGSLAGRVVSVRRSRRSPASLAWELDLLHRLKEQGFCVPLPVLTADGASLNGGVVVQEWIDGGPPATEDDWRAVAAELQRLHASDLSVDQRPGCMSVPELGRRSRSVDADVSVLPDEVADLVLDVFASFANAPVSVIHGDPDASNLRITRDGRVGLLDWDESRIDISWHDLSNLGIAVLDAQQHARAQHLSDAWEAVNAWTCEPDYARRRLAGLLA